MLRLAGQIRRTRWLRRLVGMMLFAAGSLPLHAHGGVTLYLKGDGAVEQTVDGGGLESTQRRKASPGHPRLPSLSITVPTATLLPTYDPGRDRDAGFTIVKGGSGPHETDTTKYQQWVSPTDGVALSNAVSLVFWSAMNDFDTAARGSVGAYLLECDGDGSKCTQIAHGQKELVAWSGGSSTWVEHTIDFGTVIYTVPAGRALSLKLIVGSDADDSMWFAYDTMAYPSRLGVVAPSLSVTKVASIVSDPLGSASYHVPGTVVRYTITVTNSGGGSPDNSSLDISDVLPTEMELFIGANCGDAIGFSAGTSGLSFDCGTDLEFSGQPGGTFPDGYDPYAAPLDQYDAAVTGVLLTPRGIMNTDGASFTYTLDMRVE